MPTSLGTGTILSTSESDVSDVVLRASLGQATVSSKVYSTTQNLPKVTILAKLKESLVVSAIAGKLSAFGHLGVATLQSVVQSAVGDIVLTPPAIEPVINLWIAKADAPNTRADLNGYSLAIGDSLTAGIEVTGERLSNLTLVAEVYDVATGDKLFEKSTGGQGIVLSETMPIDGIGKLGKRAGFVSFTSTETGTIAQETTQLQLVFRLTDSSGYRFTFQPVTISVYKI